MLKFKSPKNMIKKAVFGLATLGFLGGGVGCNDKSDQKEEDQDTQEPQEETQSPKSFVESAMSEYYPELRIAIEELETNRETPVKQSGENRYTYWNGLTWVYTIDGKGNIIQHACVDKYKNMAAKMDDNQREEQFRLHLQAETFKILEGAIKDKNNIDHKQIIGLCMMGYQLSGKMAPIAKHLNNAKNTQQIMDAFKYELPKQTKWRAGTLKRRWWCGAYAAGLITAKDLLTLKKDAFSCISLSKVATGITKNKRGYVVSIEHFNYDAETVKYALHTAQTHGDGRVVADILRENESGRAAIAAIKTGKTIEFYVAKRSMDSKKYDDAMALFNKGDYKSAAMKFANLLRENPKDASLWNDLALAFVKLGEYDRALECTDKILNVVQDSSQYGAAYYNAGLAYEGLGKYDDALTNYRLAKQDGNRGANVENAITRMENKINKSGKAQAYINGTRKINARNASHHNIKNTKSRTYNV